MKDFPDWFFEKADWQEKTLGEIAEFYSGGTPSNSEENYNGKIPFIRSGEIHFDKTALFISETGLKNSSAKLVSKGNLLYALYGATSGECDISKIDGAINQAILCIIPKEFDSVFLKNLLTYKKSWIVNKFLQGGQGNLSSELIKKLQFKFPPPETQKKIADYFTSLDNAITAQEIKLQSWRDAKKSMLQKIFSQDFYFTAGNGEQYPVWQEKTLGEVCSYISKRGTCSQTEYVGTENMLQNFSGVDFKNEIEKIFTGISYQIDDILFSNIRPYLKKVWKADKKGCASTDILVMRAEKNISADFLYYSVANDELISKVMTSAKGTKMPRGDKNFIMNLKIKIPCLEEQKKIADYFSSLDRIIDVESKILENLRLMKRGLLQKLFV